MKIKFFIALFVLFLIGACSVEHDKEKKGPENSWWLGGADGGVYIKILENENLDNKLYQGVIFFDHDKTVWYRGPFKLVGNINFSVDNHDLYLFWDGERVHLKESSYLDAIEPVPPL
jgi:hypothetical protein